MKLLAIDGNSILNRAFYGIRLLSTKDGTYTNAIYGFLNVLLKLKEKEAPDGIAVAFDLHAPTFRHKAYAEYKAGRKPMPEELRSQFPIIKELLPMLGVTCLSLEGYEADDILGTLAAWAEADPSHTCVIATGDRDSFQLVSDQTTVLLSSTQAGQPTVTECTPKYILENYGVTPAGMIEIKAIQGDKSDNIPGVDGIGEKGAADLIIRYGSVDEIYAHLDELDITERMRAKLAADKENVYLSRMLGTIKRDVPLDTTLDALFSASGDSAAAARLMSRLELFSLLTKFGLDREDSPEKVSDEAPEYRTVGFEEFKEIARKATLVSAVFGENSSFFADGAAFTCDDESKAASLLALPSNKNIYDVKNVYKRFGEDAIGGKVVFDTMLAGYLLDPNAKDNSLTSLCERYGVTVPEGDGQAAANALLYEKLSEKLRSAEMLSLLTDIELPLARVLADMENTGFLIDIEGIRKYGDELEGRIASLRDEVIREVGYEFNLNSPKQLGVALFETLGLPCKKKTKSGYSTSADVLDSLKYESSAVANLLGYRALTKLKSTYCDGLAAAVSPDGRVRSVFNQTETRTGRISSSEPNLQNIPVRREEGRQLRGFFIARDGYTLVDADYSQIELRVLAAVSGDRNMINAFNSGADIHTSTAAQVFGMPEDMVTPQMRSRAKAVNFGIVYGIGAYSLSQDIGVSFGEAKKYIAGYLSTYSGVDRYMKNAVESAKELGYAETLFSRRRPIPELRSSNAAERSFGERVARNAPIQGTAADIIKTAMIRVYDRLRRELPEGKLILQVHDELILEVPEKDRERASLILREEMESAAELSVKLSADVHSGSSWLEAKD